MCVYKYYIFLFIKLKRAVTYMYLDKIQSHKHLAYAWSFCRVCQCREIILKNIYIPYIETKSCRRSPNSLLVTGVMPLSGVVIEFQWNGWSLAPLPISTKTITVELAIIFSSHVLLLWHSHMRCTESGIVLASLCP